MVGDEEVQEVLKIFFEHNSPVVDQALAEEKVVAGEQKVPGESTEPREIVEAVDGESDGDYLLEAFELD